MPTLYLIDGYAQFFRAYHAIRTPMTSPVTKEPTNMSFGFIGMLLKLLRGGGKIGGKPDFLACVLDVSDDRGTFRSQLYPDYKAHRPPPPEDLFPQVDRCNRTMQAIGIPLIGAAGFEADDVIATLVSRYKAKYPDLLIRIISKDKDLKQLLEPGRVELFDVHTDLVIDAAGLKAETGLEPPQIIDMLALMGDTADNVPGVDGVGPKTAAELIVLYGSLENLLAHASEIKGKRGEKIREAAPRLALSRQLVTLRHDAPADLPLESTAVSNLHLQELIPVLKELGFNRYQEEVNALLGLAPTQPAGTPDLPVQGATAAQTARRPKPQQAARPQESPGLFGGSLFEQASTGTAALTDGEGPGSDACTDVPARRAQWPEPHHYRCVRTQSHLAELIAELAAAPIFAIDTETTGLSPLRCELCGLSFSTRAGTGWYVPVRSPEPDTHLDEATVLNALRPLLEDGSRAKCGHNIKFDMLVLRNAGVRLRGAAYGGGDLGGFDSMVASYLIDASRSSHSMDALSLALLNHTDIAISELIGSGSQQRSFATVPVALAAEYAAEDADVTFRLREVMLPQLQAMGLMDLMQQVEMPLVEVLAELEWNGILVNAEEFDRQRLRLSEKIVEIRRQIDEAAFDSLGRTFNPDSPKQLSVALFNKPDAAEPGLGIKPVKRTATGFSTDVEVLEKLAEDPSVSTPIPRLIVDHRQLTKLVSTYLVALKDEINPRTGRIHASFNQTVAVTGRLASSDPNLQNIPIRTDVGREIRRAFIAPPGRVLISADYSQIELRLLAHLSRDPALMQAFMEDQDIHTAVAAQIHGVPPEKVTKAQRSGAKMVNFGIVYGITPFGLARRLGIGNSEAEEIITAYKKRFAGITIFLQECIAFAQRHGYVETMLKRRRPLPDIESTIPARRAFAERNAINSVVQGSAADLIKLAMVDLHARLENGQLPGVKMLLQIHDELVFESPAETAEAARDLVVDRMQSAMTLSVPLKVDASIAANWFDGK